MPFLFTATPPLRPSGKVIILDSTIQTKLELLRLFAKELDFPEYFGYNWDSLYDSLRDEVSSLKGELFIFHRSLVSLTTTEQKTYLKILQDILDFDSRVTIWFNQCDRDSVLSYLK
ncbi:hypothetical protein K7432_010776 [Basidiobolus ranarum]|uniref:Barstar (barnase inhibitor) domain-containing protein n=1 Tax=Basidiobolus ranarum TaxID=34480 RepID=A0ABR2VUY3_9FUNG